LPFDCFLNDRGDAAVLGFVLHGAHNPPEHLLTSTRREGIPGSAGFWSFVELRGKLVGLDEIFDSVGERLVAVGFGSLDGLAADVRSCELSLPGLRRVVG
jgi:hypothetical protein